MEYRLYLQSILWTLFRLVLVASARKSEISDRAPVLNRQTAQILAPAALMIVLVKVVQQQDETDQHCNKRSDA